MIDNIYFDKASYNGLDTINLIIENTQSTEPCTIEIFELDKLIKTINSELLIGLNSIELGFFENKLAGYRIFVKQGNVLFTQVFSIDPNEKIIRYGFLSDFEKFDDDEDIKWMNSNHLNYIQFYDWSYRHHKMLPPKIIFKDAMNKVSNLDVIKKKIESCTKRNMKTMAYGPVYAASKDFFEDHKEAAYYSHDKKPLTFIDIFYFMNISEKSNWPKHIISQYKESIEKLGFSGIHLDTYGYPKRALDYNNQVKYLEKDLPIFLDKVAKELKEAPLIFNNVGAWPLGKIMDCNQKAIYIEVWPPYETFYNLKEIITKAKESLKPVVLASYIASFRLDRERALYSALLTTFYINTLGATHLYLGEEGCVITQGYYCDYTKLRDNEILKIQRYQDFFVSYQQLLFDESLKDVSMTHCGWDNEEYKIDGNYSLTSEANKISTVIRSNGKKHLISFLNLENNDFKWNEGKNEPNLSSVLHIEVQVFKSVESVYFTDPDSNIFLPQKLDFTRAEGSRSDIIKFRVPSFKVGSIIWLEEK
jgi:dextranase